MHSIDKLFGFIKCSYIWTKLITNYAAIKTPLLDQSKSLPERRLIFGLVKKRGGGVLHKTPGGSTAMFQKI